MYRPADGWTIRRARDGKRVTFVPAFPNDRRHAVYRDHLRRTGRTQAQDRRAARDTLENLLGMADYKRARWGLRRTFQTEMAIEQLSVFDNVAMKIHEHSGAKRASRRPDVLAAIDFVGLEAPPKTRVGELGVRE